MPDMFSISGIFVYKKIGYVRHKENKGGFPYP